VKPYFQHGEVTIYHGDVTECSLPVMRADVLLTDPPYSRAGALSSGRSNAALMAAESAGSDQFWVFWFKSVASRVLPLVKESGCGFIFSDYRTLHLVERSVAAAGCGWHMSQGLVWDRASMGMGTPFRASHELIGFCRGAHFKWTGRRDLVNVLRFPWTYAAHEHHPAEKPVDLLGFLITQTTKVGDLVFDPFCGSGSTLVAAQARGRKAVGIEADEQYCEIAARRLLQGSLFSAGGEVQGAMSPTSATPDGQQQGIF
jgi:site-specific DNA-methyltransferase (adenine-specific)